MTINLYRVAILVLLIGIGVIWLMIRNEKPESDKDLSDRQW